jgi:hypothetical protein
MPKESLNISAWQLPECLPLLKAAETKGSTK